MITNHNFEYKDCILILVKTAISSNLALYCLLPLPPAAYSLAYKNEI